MSVCLVPVVANWVCELDSEEVRPHGVIRSRPGGLEFINNGADERQEHERQGTNGQSSVVV